MTRPFDARVGGDLTVGRYRFTCDGALLRVSYIRASDFSVVLKIDPSFVRRKLATWPEMIAFRNSSSVTSTFCQPSTERRRFEISPITHGCFFTSASVIRSLGDLVISPRSNATMFLSSWPSSEIVHSSVFATFSMISGSVPVYGTLPNAIACSVIPSDHTSAAFGSYCRLPTCDHTSGAQTSGAVYAGVPGEPLAPTDSLSSPASWRIRETPKSASTARVPPSASFAIRMLSGLRSKWTTPWKWRYSSPTAASIHHFLQSPISSGSTGKWCESITEHSHMSITCRGWERWGVTELRAENCARGRTM